MPDKFVAYDSTLNTSYFNDLITTRTLRQVTLTYYLENKEDLEERKLEEFISDFKISGKMMNELKIIGRDLDIEYNEEDFQASESHIKAYMKAEIARSVWGDSGFYPIYNAVSNGSFEQALTVFDEAQALLLNN